MFLDKFRVPIPDRSRIRDGKVQFNLYRSSWSTIGKLPTDGSLYDEDGRRLMIPNGVYRQNFQSDYREDVVDKDPDNIPPFFPDRVKIGPYALFLGAVSQSGLYDLLIDVFGIETANAILDLAMFYNMSHRTDISSIHYAMEEYPMFSVRVHTDKWYENQLDSSITDAKIKAFQQRWTKLRQDAGPRDTAIHITARGADWMFRESGVPQLGVMAVCETGGDYPGLPLAYRLYRGFYPSETALQAGLDLFRDLGLAPKRIIASRPFCRIRFLDLCDKLHLPWLVMLQPYYVAHETMLDRHETELIQGQGTPITAREPLIAAGEDNIPLFDPDSADPDRTGFVALYCIPKDAQERSDYFNKKLEKTLQEACSMLEKIQNSGAKDRLPIPSPSGDTEEDDALEEDLPEEDEDASDEEDLFDEDEDDEFEDEDDEDNGENPSLYNGKEYIDHTDYDSAEVKAHSILKSAVSDAGGLFYSPDKGSWNSVKLVYHPEEGRYQCAIDEDEAQYYRCLDAFIGLASSEPMDLQEMADAFPMAYLLGESDFNPTFSAMHTQLNNKVPGFLGVSPWFFVAFIADIVRALLMPSFKQFEAAKDGEIREEERRTYYDEDLDGREPTVRISIRKMISWLQEILLIRFSANSDFFVYNNTARGVRKAVLEAAGVQEGSLQMLEPMLEDGEYPDKLRELRKQKRTIPAPYVPKRRGRSKGSKDGPNAD